MHKCSVSDKIENFMAEYARRQTALSVEYLKTRALLGAVHDERERKKLSFRYVMRKHKVEPCLSR
jgi:hypothetical protein